MLKYYCDNNRHLVCKPYSIENLHTMANDLNIDRSWFHVKGKNIHPHYDIPKKREKEITSKCTIISTKEILKIIGK